VAELRLHLDQFTAPDTEALVFASPAGRPLRHSHFRQRVWRPAADAIGMTSVHVHDLRRTGNNLSAAAGASLRELMDRMGHASTRAALIYLHGSDERQRKIASNLDALARAELAKESQRRQPRSPRGTSLATHEADDGQVSAAGFTGRAIGLTCGYVGAPRAGLEPAAYCLGGTAARALCIPAKTHVAIERNSQRQSFSQTIFQRGEWRAPSRHAKSAGVLSAGAPMLGSDRDPSGGSDDRSGP
jgi:Phage integrase family